MIGPKVDASRGDRRRSGHRFNSGLSPLMAATQDLVCVCRDGVVEDVNDAGATLLGAGDPTALAGHRFTMFVPHDYAQAVEDLLALREIEQGSIPIHLKTLSGADVEAELTIHPAREMGDGRVIVTARDISRQGRLARSALERENRFRLLVDNSMHMICRCLGGHITYVNPAGLRMLGADVGAVEGLPVWELFHGDYRDVFAADIELLLSERALLPARLRRFDGEPIDAQIMITPLPSAGLVPEYMLEASDITGHNRAVAALRRINENLDRLVAERTRELERLAITDPLTGAFNRRHFIAVAAAEVRRAHRAGTPLSALMVDIDHFKKVNDTYGHATGDDAIKGVAVTCIDSSREVDCVGRLGGEEFAIILPGLSSEDAVHAGERLRRAIARLVMIAGSDEVRVTASIGVATLAAGDRDHESLLANADRALYKAKHAGRDRVETS